MPSWTDGVYLSTDASLSVLGTQLATDGHSGTLQPGQSYSNTINVTLPQDIGGTFDVIVYVDTLAFDNYAPGTSDIGFNLDGLRFGDGTVELPPFDLVSAATRSLGVGQVPEYQGDGHNIGVAALPVTLETPVDLAVSQVTAPTTATVGGQIDVSWIVTDQGGATVPGQDLWTDEVYLAADNNPDIDLQSDTYLGMLSHTGALAADGTYTASGYVRAAGGPGGALLRLRRRRLSFQQHFVRPARHNLRIELSQ